MIETNKSIMLLAEANKILNGRNNNLYIPKKLFILCCCYNLNKSRKSLKNKLK